MEQASHMLQGFVTYLPRLPMKYVSFHFLSVPQFPLPHLLTTAETAQYNASHQVVFLMCLQPQYPSFTLWVCNMMLLEWRRLP